MYQEKLVHIVIMQSYAGGINMSGTKPKKPSKEKFEASGLSGGNRTVSE